MQHIKLLSVFVLIISLSLLSCKKDAAPKNKTTLLQKRSYTQGTSSWAEELQYDDRGRVIGFIATNSEPTFNYSATIMRNSEGKIARLTFSDNRGYYVYEHNAQGKLIKTSGFQTSGAAGFYETYTYYDDRYETFAYNSAGLFTGKNIYYYTTDKKNIAIRKQYNSSLVQTQEVTFTYAESKNNYTAFVESSPFVSANMIASEVTKTFSPASTNTATSSYTYNADGSPATMNKTYTSGMNPLTGKYEYITR
ncbi:hypothetical protein ACFS6H_20650 [Terrimonas rubra]|uniref:YD repeat-containing protein n=1 Tax=Terrimonas rubra TaxID=1035890 RepID=A0ABW6ADU3_9BACT